VSNDRDGLDPAVYQGIVPTINPPNIFANRAPTANDRRYKLGTEWIDKTTNGVYKLTTAGASGANWEVLAPAGGVVATLTGDSGGAISPTSGNININGTAAKGLSFSGSGSTITGTIADATTAQKGVLETATDAEAIAAASTAVALVPANLAAITATNMTALTATSAVTQTGTSTATYVTPAGLASLRSATNTTFTQSPILESNANTGAAPSGATGDINLMSCQDGEILEQFIMGAGQTIIAPRMGTSGLLVSLDLTDNEGAEYNWGTRANSKHAYTIGTSPAFFLEWRFTLADVTGCDPVYIGFRKQEANNGTFASYTDFAAIGVNETANSALITISTRLNSGAVTNTNTTNAWTDGQTHTLRVNVSAAGVVTYLIDGVAPTVTAAFTFDSTDVVMPFFHGLHGTTAPGAWNWVHVKAGLQ
jgi:hypothetical protein